MPPLECVAATGKTGGKLQHATRYETKPRSLVTPCDFLTNSFILLAVISALRKGPADAPTGSGSAFSMIRVCKQTNAPQMFEKVNNKNVTGEESKKFRMSQLITSVDN